MYALSLVTFSLVEMLAWYMILSRLHLFSCEYSFLLYFSIIWIFYIIIIIIIPVQFIH